MCIYTFPSARSISVLPTPSAGSAETLTPKCNAILRVSRLATWLVNGDGEGEDRGTGKRDVSVYEDKRVLSDPDWDDPRRDEGQVFDDCGRGGGVGDDCSGPMRASVSGLIYRTPNDPTDALALILPPSLPKPPFNPRRPITPPAPSRKRTAPEERRRRGGASGQASKDKRRVINRARESK
ncbi:hypothetical protein JVT61DRAFT_9144 [Boletus reticuloceps]|uniref:Uncharacterized protein n=1 Tax=Boletus reticuloceps TaxID=495285 RepID=A0A8I2YGY2_9AGAM|nr:hypothetical protein JVT61DRAFT_9144 [Boletus reticuloceps]